MQCGSPVGNLSACCRLLALQADAGLASMKSSKEYRALAAECLRLAATTDDANSYTQYTALAEMWTQLADEAETQRAILSQAQDAFNEPQMTQQQQQAQAKKPEGDKA